MKCTYKIDLGTKRVLFNVNGDVIAISFDYITKTPDVEDRRRFAFDGDEYCLTFLVARDELIEKGLIAENI